MVEKHLDVRIAPDDVLAVLQGERVRPSCEPVTCRRGLPVEWRRDDSPHESIALADDGLDESRSIRVFAQRLSDLSNRGIDRRVAIEEHLRAPQSRIDAVAVDERARAL